MYKKFWILYLYLYYIKSVKGLKNDVWTFFPSLEASAIDKNVILLFSSIYYLIRLKTPKIYEKNLITSKIYRKNPDKLKTSSTS